MFVPKSFVSKLLFLFKTFRETFIISCSIATKSRQFNQLSSWFIYNLIFVQNHFPYLKILKELRIGTAWPWVAVWDSRVTAVSQFFSGHNSVNCLPVQCPQQSVTLPLVKLAQLRTCNLSFITGLLLALILYKN